MNNQRSKHRALSSFLRHHAAYLHLRTTSSPRREVSSNDSLENMSHPPPYTPRALRPYRRYPTLYAERKHPHIPSTLPSAPFRLLDLSGELRMRIYEAAFTLPFSIELCP